MRAHRCIVNFGLGALLLAALWTAPAIAGKTRVAAQWLDREVSIDGEIDEWRDRLEYVKSVDSFVAVFNDDSALYLCLYSQNPEIARQLAREGLRARFETRGMGDYVVHFPPGARPERATGRPVEASRSDDVIELEIPGQRDRVAVSSGGEAGIEAAASVRGSFVYELKVPLAGRTTERWTLDLAPGEVFKLVIDTPPANVPEADANPGERVRNPNTPFDPGPLGSGRDAGWAGRPGGRGFPGRLAFVFKARVALAPAPRR